MSWISRPSGLWVVHVGPTTHTPATDQLLRIGFSPRDGAHLGLVAWDLSASEAPVFRRTINPSEIWDDMPNSYVGLHLIGEDLPPATVGWDVTLNSGASGIAVGPLIPGIPQYLEVEVSTAFFAYSLGAYLPQNNAQQGVSPWPVT